MNQLIPMNNISSLVATYKVVCEDLSTADQIIERVKRTMQNTLGEYRNRIHEQCLPYSIWSRAEIKRQFWRYIIDETQLLKLVSLSTEQKIYNQMESGDLPEVSEETVWQYLNDYIASAQDIIDEAIEELFKWLTPQYTRYKTNQKHEIGEKVIISSGLDPYIGSRLNTYHEKYLDKLDRLFHLMDGKGIPKYPDNLVTILNQRIAKKESVVHTEYFRTKFYYRSKTVHLEFKRKDLVRAINKRVGKRVLPPNT